MKFENKKVIYCAPLPSWCRDLAIEKASEICKRKGLEVNNRQISNKHNNHLWFCPKGVNAYCLWNFSSADNDGQTVPDIGVIDVSIEMFFDCLENYESFEEVTIHNTTLKENHLRIWRGEISYKNLKEIYLLAKQKGLID